MRALFIVNPKAGRGNALRVWRRISPLISGRVGFESVIPASKAETASAAREAVRAGYERVVVLGGDGTQDLVADALAGSDTVLAAVPAGTGNDFCRNLGFPRDPAQALEVALGPHLHRLDLGRAAGGGSFLNAAGVGFDAEVATIAARFPKGLGGTLPYLAGALVTIARHEPSHLQLHVDDQHYAGPSTLIVVANGRFYGGGMKVAPGASVRDGLFDVMIAGALNRLELLNLLARVYPGTHVTHPKVRILRGTHVRIQAGPGVRAHLDGDLLQSGPMEFRLQPGALRVAAPAAGAP